MLMLTAGSAASSHWASSMWTIVLQSWQLYDGATFFVLQKRTRGAIQLTCATCSLAVCECTVLYVYGGSLALLLHFLQLKLLFHLKLPLFLLVHLLHFFPNSSCFFKSSCFSSLSICLCNFSCSDCKANKLSAAPKSNQLWRTGHTSRQPAPHPPLDSTYWTVLPLHLTFYFTSPDAFRRCLCPNQGPSDPHPPH